MPLVHLTLRDGVFSWSHCLGIHISLRSSKTLHFALLILTFQRCQCASTKENPPENPLPHPTHLSNTRIWGAAGDSFCNSLTFTPACLLSRWSGEWRWEDKLSFFIFNTFTSFAFHMCNWVKHDAFRDWLSDSVCCYSHIWTITTSLWWPASHPVFECGRLKQLSALLPSNAAYWHLYIYTFACFFKVKMKQSLWSLYKDLFVGHFQIHSHCIAMNLKKWFSSLLFSTFLCTTSVQFSTVRSIWLKRV